MTSEPIRWTQRLGRTAVAGAAAAVLVAGCGGSDSGTAKPEAAASTSATTVANATVTAANPAGNSAVTVKQFQFMPAEPEHQGPDLPVDDHGEQQPRPDHGEHRDSGHLPRRGRAEGHGELLSGGGGPAP